MSSIVFASKIIFLAGVFLVGTSFCMDGEYRDDDDDIEAQSNCEEETEEGRAGFDCYSSKGWPRGSGKTLGHISQRAILNQRRPEEGRIIVPPPMSQGLVVQARWSSGFFDGFKSLLGYNGNNNPPIISRENNTNKFQPNRARVEGHGERRFAYNRGDYPCEQERKIPQSELGPLWKFILKEYDHISLSDDDFQTKMYSENAFKRAVSLLSECSLSQSVFSRLLPFSTLRELRILSGKNPLIDKLKRRRTSAASAFLCARLCALQSAEELKEMQKNIKLLEEAGRRLEIQNLLARLSQTEHFFLSSVALEPLFSDSLVGVKRALEYFFPQASHELLELIARLPLTYFFIDVMECGQREKDRAKLVKFWKAHVSGLVQFLKDAIKLGKYIYSGKEYPREAQRESSFLLKDLANALLDPKIYDLIKSLEEISSAGKAEQIDVLPTRAYQFMELLASNRSHLLTLYFAIGQIDGLCMLAELRYMKNYCFAQYAEGESKAETPTLHIEGGWCPFLLRSVPFSCSLGNNAARTAVVTGRNGAGKSIFLTSLGVAVLMALTVSIAPATVIRVSFFDSIQSSFYVADSLVGGLSRSQAQMRRLEEIEETVESEERNYLVLLDEPMDSGRASKIEVIMKDFLASYHETGKSITVIATHFKQLGQLANDDETYMHYRVKNHVLQAGTPDSTSNPKGNEDDEDDD